MTKKINYDQHLVSAGWSDYELLDSGENMKLERFGTVIVARPETQALWSKQKPELWDSAHAVFAFRDKNGAWDIKKPIPDPWEVSWNDTRFSAQLTGFKHTGIFPEQAPNWEWLEGRVRAISSSLGHGPQSLQNRPPAPSVLNLFGYTGIASVVAAKAGAFVTHVDSSKQSLDWAHSNARRSGVAEDAVRWVLDDALAFAKREARRESRYDGIILDPPAFGRGAKGEVWNIEDDLPTLLVTLRDLLKDSPGAFLIVNGYAAGYAARSFAQALESAFGPVDGECGELYIKESQSERVIPAGIYVRFVR
ncbi:MAG: class I SAM-dependent methyltransferase [Minisyncoccia bacterium]